MVSCCSLGLNVRYSWYFLFGWISYVVRYCSITFINSHKKPNALIKVLLMSIGMSLSFIFEIIRRKRTKRFINPIRDKDTLYVDERSSLKINNFHSLIIRFTIIDYFIILGIAILDTLGFAIIQVEDAMNTESYNEINITELIHFLFLFLIVSIFSYIFLKFVLYKHHFVYIGIILIGLIIALVANILISGIKAVHFIALIHSLFFGIVLIVQKYLLHFRYISPFVIISYMGLFSFILSLIIGVILTNYEVDEGDLGNFKEIWGSYFILQAILYILGSLGYNVFLFLINFQLDPTNRMILDIFTNVTVLIIRLIHEEREINILTILTLVGYAIMLIGGLLFNETVILNICNLSENTKKEIMERANSRCEGISSLMNLSGIKENKDNAEDEGNYENQY